MYGKIQEEGRKRERKKIIRVKGGGKRVLTHFSSVSVLSFVCDVIYEAYFHSIWSEHFKKHHIVYKCTKTLFLPCSQTHTSYSTQDTLGAVTMDHQT